MEMRTKVESDKIIFFPRPMVVKRRWQSFIHGRRAGALAIIVFLREVRKDNIYQEEKQYKSQKHHEIVRLAVEFVELDLDELGLEHDLDELGLLKGKSDVGIHAGSEVLDVFGVLEGLALLVGAGEGLVEAI